SRLRRDPTWTRAATRRRRSAGARRTTAHGADEAGGSEVLMSTLLRVYALARQLVRAVHALLLPRIAERSRELADPLDRISRSVPVHNIAEGEHRHGGHGRQRFETAYGSARETRARTHASRASSARRTCSTAALAFFAPRARGSSEISARGRGGRARRARGGARAPAGRASARSRGNRSRRPRRD